MNWDNLSVGEILAQTRKEKSISLDEVASITNISKKYLTALEENRFDKLPGKIHITGFIRLYGGFLEIDENRIMEKLHKQQMLERETPLEEIMELSQSVKTGGGGKKVNPMLFVFSGFIAIIGVLLFLYLNKNQKNTNTQNTPPVNEDYLSYNNKTNIKKNEQFRIKTQQGVLSFKLVEISKNVVSILPEQSGMNPVFVSKTESLRIDYNNDHFYDYEIQIHDTKEDYAVILLKKIREARLQNQEKYTTALRNDIKANQVYQKLSFTVKNTADQSTYLWIIRKGKEEAERLKSGKEIELELIKNGVPLINSIEVNDISNIQIKIGDQVINFNKKEAKGAVGYISFSMEERNGVRRPVWKAVY